MRILISHPEKLKGEVALINAIASEDKWNSFHLRKPGWTNLELENMYNQLNEEVRMKTVRHVNFKGSCHALDEVEALDGRLAYCFLSPIFDSISKEGYKTRFKKEELINFLKKERTIKVIGLGGVTEDNYSELIEMGFDGGAFLGSIWKQYE